MKKFLWLLPPALLLGVLVALGYAGTAVVTTEWIAGQNMKVIHVNWTSAHDNDTAINLTHIDDQPFTQAVPPANGWIRQVVTVPHLNGTNPTDNYDIYLKEHVNGSFDTLRGRLLSRDLINTEVVVFDHNSGSISSVYSTAPLTFYHDNNSVENTTGRVDIYIEVPR